MPDLNDGETYEMQGSGSKPYYIKNVGGVYSTPCRAGRNQPLPTNRRTCKHTRKLRGDKEEEERIGGVRAVPPPRQPKEGEPKEAPPVLLAENWDNETNLLG